VGTALQTPRIYVITAQQAHRRNSNAGPSELCAVLDHTIMLCDAAARCSIPVLCGRHARVGRASAAPVVGEAGDVLPGRKVAQVPHTQRAVVAAARQHERGQPIPGDDVHVGLVRRHLPRLMYPTSLLLPPHSCCPNPSLGRLLAYAALSYPTPVELSFHHIGRWQLACKALHGTTLTSSEHTPSTRPCSLVTVRTLRATQVSAQDSGRARSLPAGAP
jgi:hypothetical protein